MMRFLAFMLISFMVLAACKKDTGGTQRERDFIVVGDSFIFSDVTFRMNPAENIPVTWDFGDGTVVEGSSFIIHQYKRPGIFTVTMHADGQQVRDQYVARIDFNKFTYLQIPEPKQINKNGEKYYDVPVDYLSIWVEPLNDSTLTLTNSHLGFYFYYIRTFALQKIDDTALFFGNSIKGEEVTLTLLHKDRALDNRSILQGYFKYTHQYSDTFTTYINGDIVTYMAKPL